MKNKINISFFIAIIFIIIIKPAQAALTSVNLNLPSPTTMSNGSNYYKASGSAVTYNFDIDFTNAGATSDADFTDFQITIPTQTGNIVVTWVPPGGYNPGDPATAATVIPAGTCTGQVLGAGTWANGTVRLTMRFSWAAEATNNGLHNVVAQVRAGGITLTDTVPQVYGITSDIRVFNFSQDGVAADAYISPTHASFNVSGTIIYDLPNYNLETAADAVDDTDITAVDIRLYQNTGPTFFNNWGGGANAVFTGAIPLDFLLGAISDLYYWQARVTLVGTIIPEDSGNTLNLECNQIDIYSITFSGSVGRDLDPVYYRSYGTPGTLITINARNQVNVSGWGMHGDTTFTIQYTDGTNTGNFNVTITSGNTTGTAAVEYNNATGFLNAWTADPSTTTWTYSVSAVANTVQGNNYVITAPSPTPQILWDRNDPPAAGTPSINVDRVQQTATTATIYWTPLVYTSGTADGDLYEYKIYYRRTGDPSWLLWNGNNDTSLRYNNLASQIAGGFKYTTLTSLAIYTEYQYYVSAIDIFGNEIPLANSGSAPGAAGVGVFRTQPFSVEITLSDGITTHDSFADLTPTVRPLRATNIRVQMTIVATDEVPEEVRLWYASGNIATAPDIVNTGTNSANTAAFPANSLFSAEAQQLNANTWVAFISTNSGLLTEGNSIRFVVETVRDSVRTFTDTDFTDADPNDDEYTFYIAQTPVFTPWPVRILNNVITDRNPVAYPAYYLTADAYVTIKVYDIKGRAVATILDKALRRGGQNIKENGWRGRNRAGKKLGIGLYYIQIKAKRVSDGKIILNKFKKVVMRR